MKLPEKMTEEYEKELWLLKKLTIVSEAIMYMAEEGLFAQAEAMLKKRKNILLRLSAVISGLKPYRKFWTAVKERGADEERAGALISKVACARQRVRTLEKEIYEQISIEQEKIAREMKRIRKRRRTIRKYSSSKKNVPKYFSCSI